MKKRIWSLILALCMSIMLVPSSVSAEETDWKEIYFDFLKDELITKKNSNYWTVATLADLNLDGTPELIMCYGGSQFGYNVTIFQIIDNKMQVRYGGVNRNEHIDELNSTGYIMMLRVNEDVYGNEIQGALSLRKNKYTDELMYINFLHGQSTDGCVNYLHCFSKDKLFNASKSFLMDYQSDDETGDITSADYRIDGNAVSKEDYDISYNEFLDTWQDTNYNFAYLDDLYNITEQQIRDFLNYYIPEKQFLGIADEDNTNKYGYVDVMPVSRQEFDDRYEIKVSYKNNSSETITNKRIVLACTTLTNSKTKKQSEVVAAYKDSEDVFNPYEEKIVTTRIHCKKTSDGIPYVIGDKPFSSNYRRYHSFLDDMTLITVQFANDKEYNDFMAEIEANHLTDLSTDEYIESNSMWLKTFKGDK